MFSFFKRKKAAPETPAEVELAAAPPAPAPAPASVPAPAAPPAAPVATPAPAPILHTEPGTDLFIEETAERPTTEAEKKRSWMTRLKAGLSKTSNNLSLLFVGARIDEDLY